MTHPLLWRVQPPGISVRVPRLHQLIDAGRAAPQPHGGLVDLDVRDAPAAVEFIELA